MKTIQEIIKDELEKNLTISGLLQTYFAWDASYINIVVIYHKAKQELKDLEDSEDSCYSWHSEKMDKLKKDIDEWEQDIKNSDEIMNAIREEIFNRMKEKDI